MGGRCRTLGRPVRVSDLIYVCVTSLIHFASKSNAWELNNGDFKIYDDFLRHSMDRARDGGIDSMYFLDRVAEVVARTPCPAFSSFTRVADLLLTQCEMADARQLPSNLFEFVNNMLVSTYPPEPRNLKPSTWLISTLTRIIDTCQLDLRVDLLETIQEGACLWIIDERRVFSEDEYAFDVLPLYQTALLSIKELPWVFGITPILSPLLKSAICGRGDAPSVVKEAFIDFWTGSFPSIDEPPSDWPEDIRVCLRYCGLLPADAASEELSSELSELPSESTVCGSHNESMPEMPRYSSVTLPDESDGESISTETRSDDQDSSSVIGRLRPASFTPPKRLEESDVKPVPSTPTKAPSLATTPPRPQKPAMTPESYQSLVLRTPSGTLPLLPSTPKRTSCFKVSSSLSPSKRTKLQDKENVSPMLVLSVMERMTKSSPGPILHGPPASVLGKRQMMEDAPYESIQKRGRTTTPPATFIRSSIAFPSSQDSDVDEELAVANSLFPPVGGQRTRRDAAMYPNEFLSQGSPVSRKRKRQRCVLDAVVVPPLIDVRRQWQLQRRASAEDSAVPQMGLRLHRTTSLSGLPDSEGDSLPRLRGKRMKRLDDAELAESVLSYSSLKAFDDVVIAGSGEQLPSLSVDRSANFYFRRFHYLGCTFQGRTSELR